MQRPAVEHRQTVLESQSTGCEPVQHVRINVVFGPLHAGHEPLGIVVRKHLNPALQTPARDAFVRVLAEFEYDNGPEAALGPFATVDSVTLSFTFN